MREPIADGEPAHRSRGRHTTIIVLTCVLMPLLLVAAVPVSLSIWTSVATGRLVNTAQTLLVGTTLEDLSPETLRAMVGSGNILCMDNCIYLMVDVPAAEAAIVEGNVAEAGWTVDEPGCLTNPERQGPPCNLLDENGRDLGLVDYFPGPDVTLMLGPA
jgi:hypothetical protein